MLFSPLTSSCETGACVIVIIIPMAQFRLHFYSLGHSAVVWSSLSCSVFVNDHERRQTQWEVRLVCFETL